MGKLIFITGGTRSGKSSLAVNMAGAMNKKKIFMATCIPRDAEMKERVALHRKSRPASWTTVEVKEGLFPALEKRVKSDVVIIIDCLTLFISSLLMKNIKQEAIKKEAEKIVRLIKNGKAVVIVVSNELGSGVVPENKVARDFRDIAGFCNQIFAAAANEVNLMVSGIPLQIKRA